MRIEQIETALREGVPFQITTAAGDKFVVDRREHLAISEKTGSVVVISEDGLAHVVPLLTMTSLTYLKAAQS